MITCEEFTNRITAYLDGRMPMGTRVGMWLHALICGPCRRYLHQMKLTIELLGELPEGDRPDDVPSQATKDDLLDEFRLRHSDTSD